MAITTDQENPSGRETGRGPARALQDQADWLAAILAAEQAIVAAGPHLQNVLNLLAEQSQALTKADGALIELG